MNLTIDLSSTSNSNETACDSYTWNGQTYTSSGTYTQPLTNSTGCDSTAVLNLIINPITTSTTDSSTCSTSGIIWNGQTYTSTGSYTYQTIGSNGCDSIATLNCTFNPTTTSTTNSSSCDPYLWNGNTYDVSGTYTYLINNISGCDSIATLNLTINSATSSLDSITACNAYNWNGNTFSTSDSYTYTTVNANGCDSIANLVLDVIEVNLFLPNTFTPNNDNMNEQFGVYENGVQDYEIWIFNRWGEQIFYSNNPKDGWNGKYKDRVSQDGVYAWRIIYYCGDKLEQRAGIVTILR